MKTVTITKDAYTDNSVRVNYLDKSATKKERKMKNISSFIFSLSGGLPTPEDIFEEVEVTYENLLFCERLKWITEESEIDNLIENKKLELEEKINQ